MTLPNTAAASQQPEFSAALEQVHGVYRKWFGERTDLEIADGVLATGMSREIPGAPLWTAVIGGPSSAKTEYIYPLTAVGGHLLGDVSRAALMPGQGKKDRDDDATGGLLKQYPVALMLFKDFTTILSQPRESRKQFLAALREIYDQSYSRDSGGGGGIHANWTGRWDVVAACTSSWDTTERDAAAKMGDRLLQLRFRQDHESRMEAARQAVKGAGKEEQMRTDICAVVGALFDRITSTDKVKLIAALDIPPDVEDAVVQFADFICISRSQVEYDYRGTEVTAVHEPESPPRVVKQLVQIWKCALAIGRSPLASMQIVRRFTMDSVPPLRRAVLRQLAIDGCSTIAEVAGRIGMPETTVRRDLQALAAHGLVYRRKIAAIYPPDGYVLCNHIDSKVVDALRDALPYTIRRGTP